VGEGGICVIGLRGDGRPCWLGRGSETAEAPKLIFTFTEFIDTDAHGVSMQISDTMSRLSEGKS